MRKIFAITTAALALAGCGRYGSYEATRVSGGYRVDYPGIGEYTLINVWRDPVTGCEHYVTDDGFISPRLNADGTQRCVRVTR